MLPNTSTAEISGQDDAMLPQADAETVLEHFASGRPLDPSVAQRVRAQAANVVEQIKRARGLVDDKMFQSLLDEET